MFGRGSPKSKGGQEGYSKKTQIRMSELVKIAEFMKEKGGKGAAIITHLAWIKYFLGIQNLSKFDLDKALSLFCEDFRKKNGCAIGWFGQHDRGHDEWNGYHIAIVGAPLINNDAAIKNYFCDRAAMLTVGVAWDIWDGEFLEDDLDNCVPGLPSSSLAMNHLLESYAATWAQSAGRSRAVRSPTPIAIEIFGGIQNAEMEDALLKMGLPIQHRVSQCFHRTQRDYYNRGEEEAKFMVEATIKEMVMNFEAEDGISCRQLKNKLRTNGKKASNSLVEGVLASFIQKGICLPKKNGKPFKSDLNGNHPDYF